MAFEDFKFKNIRKVLKGHMLGAAIGGIAGYLLFKYHTGASNTFAIAPLESALTFVKAEPNAIVMTIILIGLGAFIGAFIQARGKY